MAESLCHNCENYATKLKILIPNENSKGKWIPKSNNGLNTPVTYIVKEESGDCTIKFENGEKVKHAKLSLVPFCNLGLEGFPKSECSKFKPRG